MNARLNVNAHTHRERNKEKEEGKKCSKLQNFHDHNTSFFCVCFYSFFFFFYNFRIAIESSQKIEWTIYGAVVIFYCFGNKNSFFRHRFQLAMHIKLNEHYWINKCVVNRQLKQKNYDINSTQFIWTWF